jgi:hypothetical protein
MKRDVTELRPTQFALGMLEVEKKAKKLRAMKAGELKEYLEGKPVPVVICLDKQAHIVDHHHLVRACWEIGIDKIVTELKADLSHLKPETFWEEMKRLGWTHLYDQFGNGPHAPALLPLNVRGLADDPFRSLAWAVREAGGFEKVETPFCEFHWADFFRKKVQLARTDFGMDKALKHALELAVKPDAKHLPGWTGGKKG